MKILYCHNQYRIRSGEDIAHDFACELLQRSGHEVQQFGANNSEIDQYSLADKLLLPGRIVHAPKKQAELESVIEKYLPEIAIVQNVFPLLSPAVLYTLRRANIPILQIVYNYRIACLNGQFFTHGKICECCLHGSFLNGVVRKCFRDSASLSAMYALSLGFHRTIKTWQRCIDLFVCPDAFLGRKLVEAGISPDRILTVCNPIKLNPAEPDYRHENYGLFVGRLIRAKGIFTLLEAVLRSQQPRPLVIVGEGEDEGEVRSHPAVLQGKVELVGARYGPDFMRLLQAATFIAVPSEWYDNLPMIICQAFDLGKPVVASRINGIPEYVHHEENGLLFEPGDAQGFAAAMTRLFTESDLQRKLGYQARQTALRVFSPEVWSSRFEDIFSRLTSQMARPS